MPATFNGKLRRVGNSYVVTIPKPVIEGMEWTVGDTLRLIVSNSDLRIVKLRSI